MGMNSEIRVGFIRLASSTYPSGSASFPVDEEAGFDFWEVWQPVMNMLPITATKRVNEEKYQLRLKALFFFVLKIGSQWNKATSVNEVE